MGLFDSLGDFLGGNSSFWDSGSTGSNWTSLIGPLLQGGIKTFGDISTAQYNNDLQQEKWAHDDRQHAQDQLLQLQLEQIKAMYGGGGGNPGNRAAMTDAQKLAAMQNARQTKIGVLENLVNTYGSFFR